LFEQPMTEIAERFRRISVTLDRDASCPGSPPANWVDLSAAGNVVSFVDTHFSDLDLGDRVRSVLTGVRNIAAEPVPLRSIFTAMERHAVSAAGGES
jgi:hypothetical protein